jgi:hypothetical protein
MNARSSTGRPRRCNELQRGSDRPPSWTAWRRRSPAPGEQWRSPPPRASPRGQTLRNSAAARERQRGMAVAERPPCPTPPVHSSPLVRRSSAYPFFPSVPPWSSRSCSRSHARSPNRRPRPSCSGGARGRTRRAQPALPCRLRRLWTWARPASLPRCCSAGRRRPPSLRPALRHAEPSHRCAGESRARRRQGLAACERWKAKGWSSRLWAAQCLAKPAVPLSSRLAALRRRGTVAPTAMGVRLPYRTPALPGSIWISTLRAGSLPAPFGWARVTVRLQATPGYAR